MSRNYSDFGHSTFSAAVREDSFEYEYGPSRRAVQHPVASQKPRGRGKKQPPSGRRYQEKRVQQGRRANNLITEADLADELKQKLFQGVKDERTARERLETVNIMKAITLPITTRSMGLGSAHIFYSLYGFRNMKDIPARGSIYQMYRVALAILEVKVTICQRSITAIQKHEDDFAPLVRNEELISAVKGVTILPDQITNAIRALGKVKVWDSLYVPNLARDQRTHHNLLIPQAENVRYSNLRETVVALQNINTPVEYRRRFYRNNPIPGAIWKGVDNPSSDDNPILDNANEIMPEDYGLNEFNDDLQHMHAKINYLARKVPKYFTGAVNFDSDGTKAMLVCNAQDTLRLPDRGAHEPLNEYYARLRPTGDIDEYYNLEGLTSVEQIDGCLSLLGEVPTTPALEYPIFFTRNSRNCCQVSSLKYRATYDRKYT
ncbi:uncharacterized protein LOC123308102 [Coccinella septempunctata]|uniref:uncharacterized protein LOC123308102 n=1 Tax=Coccinella septempunctata TaxID=41139 RepID=UPI001D076B31|nr:uncharacterized protein LOC123308102 [Coccinella septempunctata]XP_044746581.1 uncharacterized protein LOC123308102 [Coccinella septempunctata]